MACPCRFARRVRPLGSGTRHAAESTNNREEQLVLVVFDEFDGFVVDCMVSVTPVQFDLLAVAEKMGVVGVCMPLVVVAVREVEPLVAQRRRPFLGRFIPCRNHHQQHTPLL